MRTTTLIALVGTASAKTVAPTLDLDCKLATSTTCTAALCWTGKKFADATTYKACKADFNKAADQCKYGDDKCTADFCWTGKKLNAETGCTKFNTAADKCKYSNVCTAATCWADKKFNTDKNTGCTDFNKDADKCQYGDSSTCNNTLCSGKTWGNCTTCNNTPYAKGCWTATDKTAKCQWNDTDCTVDICKGHEVIDALTAKPAITGSLYKKWGAYKWSQSCTYAKVQDMRLAALKTTAEYTTLSGKNTATQTAAKAKASKDKKASTTAASKAKTSASTEAKCKVTNKAKTPAEIKTACKADSDAAATDKTDAATALALSKKSAEAEKVADAVVAANTKWYTADNKTKLANGTKAAAKAAATKAAAAKITAENNTQAADLKACLLEDTDAKCEALKTSTDDAHTKATDAETKAKGAVAKATKATTTATSASTKAAAKAKTSASTEAKCKVTNKAKTPAEIKTACKADSDAAATDKTDAASAVTKVTNATAAETKAKADATANIAAATTKTAQVEVWVKNVDDALKNNWVSDVSQPQFALWNESGFKSAATETAAKALQTTLDTKYTTAKTASDAVHSTADEKSKTAVLLDWKNWADSYMTNVWSGNAKQPQFEKWNTAALHATTLKSDAEALQKTNKDAQKADKTAMDTANALVTSTLKTYTDDKATTATKLAASTAAAKKVTDEAKTVSAADKTANAAAAKTAKDAHTTATTAEATSKTAWDNAVTAAVAPTTKYDQISKWVVSGAKYIHNDWNGSQAWQKTWFDNKCDATKATTEADMQAIQDKTEASLTAANKDKTTLAATAVTAATANTAAKAKVTAQTDATTEPEKTANAKAASKAVTALANANSAVTANTAKIVQLKDRKTTGAAILKNTYQAHQITWMSAKINAADLKSGAEKIQDDNKKALATHKATKATTAAAITAFGKNKAPTHEETKANTKDKLDVATLDKKIAQETSWVAAGVKDLKDTTNIAKWAKNKKAADKKAAAVKAAAEAAAKKKAAATKAAAKPTLAEDKAALVKAEAAAKTSSGLVTALEKKMSTAKCTTTGKDTADCKSDAKALIPLKATSKIDAAKVVTLKAAIKAHSGSSVGIIIGCVAGALVIVGGVAYWKHKKNAEKSADSMEPMFSGDDCYKSFVDEERV